MIAIIIETIVLIGFLFSWRFMNEYFSLKKLYVFVYLTKKLSDLFTTVPVGNFQKRTKIFCFENFL